MIRVHPTKEIWDVYKDDDSIIITNNSAMTLRKEVLNKYGKSEFVILRKVIFIDSPAQRIN